MLIVSKDIIAVIQPMTDPIAKEPTKTPMKIPRDFKIGPASKESLS